MLANCRTFNVSMCHRMFSGYHRLSQCAIECARVLYKSHRMSLGSRIFSKCYKLTQSAIEHILRVLQNSTNGLLNVSRVSQIIRGCHKRCRRVLYQYQTVVVCLQDAMKRHKCVLECHQNAIEFIRLNSTSFCTYEELILQKLFSEFLLCSFAKSEHLIEL